MIGICQGCPPACPITPRPATAPMLGAQAPGEQNHPTGVPGLLVSGRFQGSGDGGQR